MQLINIIKSLLNNRTFFTKMSDSYSFIKNIAASIPQDSCLSPHLFSLYVNNLPLTQNIKVVLFADDTLFSATSTTNASAIKMFQTHDQWRITINPNKIKAIFFTNKSTQNSQKVHSNSIISWSNSINYLGIHIDKNFSKQVIAATNKAKTARFSPLP